MIIRLRDRKSQEVKEHMGCGNSPDFFLVMQHESVYQSSMMVYHEMDQFIGQKCVLMGGGK
jgi:hypothetical protein